VLRAAIDLGENDDDGNTETAAQIQVVLRHVRRWVSAIYQNKRVISEARRNTVDPVNVAADR